MKNAVCALFCAVAAIATPVNAQEFPTKSITLVVPFPAGSPTDTAARIAAQILTDQLKQTVVVDYKSGASGTIASRHIAGVEPDGYNLLATSSSTHVAAPAVMSLPYDPENDFTPISPVARTDIVVVGRKDLPVSNLKELIEQIRNEPGKLTYASSGEGTVLHLSGALFEAGIGGKLLHVPYRGAAPAAVDLLGGQVDLMFDTVSNIKQNVLANRLQAYAILAPERSKALPDVPTAAELGMPELSVPTVWLGLMGPAGMPKSVVDTLANALAKGIQDPSIQERLAGAALEPDVLPSDAFAQRNREARQVYTDLAQSSGMAANKK